VNVAAKAKFGRKAWAHSKSLVSAIDEMTGDVEGERVDGVHIAGVQDVGQNDAERRNGRTRVTGQEKQKRKGRPTGSPQEEQGNQEEAPRENSPREETHSTRSEHTVKAESQHSQHTTQEKEHERNIPNDARAYSSISDACCKA